MGASKSETTLQRYFEHPTLKGQDILAYGNAIGILQNIR